MRTGPRGGLHPSRADETVVYPSDDQALRVRLLIQEGRALRERIRGEIDRARTSREVAQHMIGERRARADAPAGVDGSLPQQQRPRPPAPDSPPASLPQDPDDPDDPDGRPPAP